MYFNANKEANSNPNGCVVANDVDLNRAYMLAH